MGTYFHGWQQPRRTLRRGCGGDNTWAIGDRTQRQEKLHHQLTEGGWGLGKLRNLLGEVQRAGCWALLFLGSQ